MFILDILHPADVVLLTNPVHADGLVLLADAAAGDQSARNCPNGWVDGTYVGMGNKYISRENFLSNKISVPKIHKRYEEDCTGRDANTTFFTRVLLVQRLSKVQLGRCAGVLPGRGERHLDRDHHRGAA